MHAIFSLASWKLGSKIHEFVEKFVDMFDNPYQQVREAIGRITAELLENEYTPSFKNVSDLLLNHDQLVPTRNDKSAQLLQRVANDLAAGRLSETSSYANMCKTGKML